MRRSLTPLEAALWRRVARCTAPLPGKTLSPEQPPAPGARPTPPAAAAHHPPRPESSPSRAAAPLDRGGERRIQRGRVEIAARLDLHGMSQDQARAALFVFLSRRRKAGARVVLVITGKGGADGGVLKRRLPEWLAAPGLRAAIVGFATAHRRHGGAGAVYVFLKRA